MNKLPSLRITELASYIHENTDTRLGLIEVEILLLRYFIDQSLIILPKTLSAHAILNSKD